MTTVRLQTLNVFFFLLSRSPTMRSATTAPSVWCVCRMCETRSSCRADTCVSATPAQTLCATRPTAAPSADSVSSRHTFQSAAPSSWQEWWKLPPHTFITMDVTQCLERGWSLYETQLCVIWEKEPKHFEALKTFVFVLLNENMDGQRNESSSLKTLGLTY